MAAAHQSERRFRGPKHAHGIVRRSGAREAARIIGRIVLVGPRHHDRGESAERRIAGALARFDLGGIKRLAILRDQRAHHRMLGLVRLQKPQADAGVAPRAPDHLMQKLNLHNTAEIVLYAVRKKIIA